MSNFFEKIKNGANSIFFRRGVLFIIAFTLFCIFYNLNRLYPIYLDDWDHSYIFWGEGKIQTLTDAVQSQFMQYKWWGGRATLHVILQMLLSWNPFWGDLLNSIVLVLFVGLIYKMANLENQTRPSLYFIVAMLLWFFQADVGETMLWLTGSVNYLWGACILLSFMFFYYQSFIFKIKEKPREENKETCWRGILFFVYGILAGWTNENMFVTAAVILFLFLFVMWRKDKKVEKWAIWGYLGMLLGGSLMLIAPGNRVRYTTELKQLGLTKADIGLSFYIDRLQVIVSDYFTYLYILLIAYLFLVILFWISSDSNYKKQILVSSIIFLIASLIAALVMVSTPEIAPRAWFGIITFVIVAVSIIFANLNFKKLYIQLFEWACVILLLVLFVPTYVEGRQELKHLRAIIDSREETIATQKAEGKTRIIFEGERFEDRDHRRLDLIIPKMYDLPQDTTHWMYKAYERYHEVEAVRFENEKPIKRN